ncbi:MAG: pyruvate dehydrogenase (acetyl-transferring) E1 component subunit alpha [Myxococcales bacterium]|nr:pyruvate dehydrogenase (acetyl-transferring) E1 component subunit alpha [Myxococcales bacterium]MCB9641991.1 pyruvate dehydrogenase (acetyl-transferring) E1 component subunit alpha [Myxococcales bacterium]
MPRKVAFEAKIEHLQILDEKGKVDKSIGVPAGLDDNRLLEMYRWMLFFRRFDEKALALQRTGRLGTYASLIGQEATQIGAAYAMEEQDWLVPSFREQGIMMARGVPGSKIITYWNGDERGSMFDEGINSLPICVPVGSQLLHAVGMAMAFDKRKENRVVLGFIGDGGTSEGDFHEACNFAGAFKAPAVIMIQNNQWAISVPRHKQTASPTLAQKSLAYGMPGLQFDGNDVMAAYQATKEALDHARSGKGPFLLEAVTFRMQDHTTADDATKYRDPSEVEAWRPRDPIARLDAYLRSKKKINDDQIKQWEEEIAVEVAKEVEDRENLPHPDPLDTFRQLYTGEMPRHLQTQMQDMKENLG